MLKIIERRFEEFCEKAKEFGFKKTDEGEYLKYKYEYGGSALNIDEEGRVFVLEGNLINDYEPLDTIYDLITQGFIEKV